VPAQSLPPNNPQEQISKIPSPIPKRLSQSQLKSIQERLRKDNNKKASFAQIANKNVNKDYANILKIKDAFPKLPVKKILDIHDSAFNTETN